MNAAPHSVSPRPGTEGFRLAVAVFVFAFFLRLIYLLEIKDSPLLETLVVDGRAYDKWARDIAAGNWIGDEVFYQAPLYPYFLATNYLLFGHDLFVVRIVQIVLGSMACAFLALAGREFFAAKVGLIAGGLLAIYPPAIFFDGLIQKSALDVFFFTLLLWIGGSLSRAPTRLKWLAAGVAIGCFCLTRENALLLFLVLGAWLFIFFRKRPRTVRFAWAGAYTLGMLLALLPVATRNLVVGGEFFVTTSQFGPNFYIGNNERATGQYAALRWGRGSTEYEREDATRLAEEALGKRLTPSEVSRYWTRQALKYIVENPGDWLRLMGRKWLLVWNATELADAEDIGTYAEHSHLLTALGSIFHFGVLLPVAAFGICATWPDRRRCWLLYVLLLTIAASVAVFFVFARYRFPLVPVLVLFAAFACTRAVDLISARALKQLSACSLCLLVASLIANWRLLPGYDPRSTTRYNLARAFELDGKMDRAIAQYERAIQLDPNNEKAHYNLGLILVDKGEPAKAVEHFMKAAAVKPDFPEARNNLGMALARTGRIDEAIVVFEECVRRQPRHAKTHYNLAVLLASRHRVEEAIAHYEEALRLQPDYPEAQNNLGLILAAKGDLEGAIRQYRQALRLRPAYERAHFNLAMALAAMGDRESALAHVREAINQAAASGQLQLATDIQQRWNEYDSQARASKQPLPSATGSP